MATGIDVSQLDGLMKSIEDRYIHTTPTDLMANLRGFPGWEAIIRRKRVSVDGGNTLKFPITTEFNDTTREVELAYETDVYSQESTATFGEVNWKALNTTWTLDAAQLAINSGPRKVWDWATDIRNQAMLSLYTKFENIIWGLALNSQDHAKRVYGIQNGIVPDKPDETAGTTHEYGFTGANAYTHSTTYGIDASTVEKFRNWSGTYTEVSEEPGGLTYEMRRMFRMTRFKSPLNTTEMATSFARGIYMPTKLILMLEYLINQRNDNLGADFAINDGRAVFRGIPLTEVPWFDDPLYSGEETRPIYNDEGGTVSDPVYMINWDRWRVAFMAGWFMRRKMVSPIPDKHNAVGMHIDNMLNTVCINRREQGVLQYNGAGSIEDTVIAGG